MPCKAHIGPDSRPCKNLPIYKSGFCARHDPAAIARRLDHDKQIQLARQATEHAAQLQLENESLTHKLDLLYGALALLLDHHSDSPLADLLRQTLHYTKE